ncbi:unnamed protein product [Rhizoctonia solani]|uniref:Structure-specific endonuclease subunit SLX4 n=1 Tax=Rhizoctonia solani TaxID=456999 RepID=A0A8H3HRF1_9AGAM|nr:unnamed protein product [Rhizoctonia solani]
MSEIKLGLAGVHQYQNASLAMHLVHRFLQLQTPALKLPDSLSPIPEVYAAGLREARWAGRCQRIADPSDDGLQWLLDGAHTIESLASCAEWYFSPELAFRDTNLKRTLIFNCSGGRAGRKFLDLLLQKAAAGAVQANYEIAHPGHLFDRVIFCTNVTTPADMDQSIKKSERDSVLALTTQHEFANAWTELVPEYNKENVHVLVTIQDAVDLLTGSPDSEPERQERLAKLRRARARLQKEEASTDRTKATISTHSPSTRTESVVSSGAPPHQGESQFSARVAKPSSLPIRKAAPPPWLAAATSIPADTQPSHASPSRSSPPKSSSQPSPIKQFDLNSFAYQKRTIRRSASYSTSARPVGRSKGKGKEVAATETCSEASELPTSSTKVLSSSKTFILGATKECPGAEASFTSEQIASLRGCVVCEHAWTTRKLPKHKWSHIMSCARKGGCDLDALYIKLIAAVVDGPSAKVKKSSKGKGKEKEEEPADPHSLLAQTVQERAPPKKRGRRAEPGPSILQPVGDTHKIIFERGIALIGVAPALDVESQPNGVSETLADDQITEEKEEAQNEEPSIPATQNFAPNSTRSYISRHEPGSPASPIDSYASFHPASRRQSFGEEWNSQEGVYMWEDYNPSRPVSPTDSLADYMHEMSLEHDILLKEDARGRSRSPRPLSKSRSRSRRSSGPSKKKPESPTKRTGTRRKKSKSPRPATRSSSRGRMGLKPTSKRAKAKDRPKSKSKSKSRSRSKSRTPPKPRRRRTARRGSVYAPKDGEDGPRKKDLDARLLDIILQDKELYLRILRYEPIKFEDILDMAIESGIPQHGLQVKLKAFLDSQCINFYTAEALGRKKKRHA